MRKLSALLTHAGTEQNLRNQPHITRKLNILLKLDDRKKNTL